MTEDKEQKKTATLRPYDKREAQRKSIKEKETEEAAEHYRMISPTIYYEGNEVNSILIWLDFIDRNGVIYIAPIATQDYKRDIIKLSYTTGKDINDTTNSKMEGNLVEEWTIRHTHKIVVKHNNLNPGITIQKILSLDTDRVEGPDDKIQRSIYIPMSRIYHIKTGELTIYKDKIEK